MLAGRSAYIMVLDSPENHFLSAIAIMIDQTVGEHLRPIMPDGHAPVLRILAQEIDTGQGSPYFTRATVVHT